MYERVGTFPRPVAPLAARLGSFRLDLSATGYGSTSERPDLVRESFYPDVGDLFPGAWSYAMLVALFPGGSLPPHRDGQLAAGSRRFHLVLQTDEYAWCMHDGAWQQPEAGGIYTMDPSRIHAAINWGAVPRIHLVIDCAGYHAD